MRLSLTAPFPRLIRIPREVAPSPASTVPPRRWGRTIVKKRGFLAPLLQPVGIALGLVIVGVPAVAIWNIYSASETRRALHEAPVNRGNTVVETKVRRQVADGETELVLRLVDGKLVRVIRLRRDTREC
jgi:hypothetical protein